MVDTSGPNGNLPLSWPYSLNRKQRRAQKKAARYANAKGGFKSREETPKEGMPDRSRASYLRALQSIEQGGC